MREDGGDGEAAGAFDVHEEGAGCGHKHLESKEVSALRDYWKGCDADDEVWEEHSSFSDREGEINHRNSRCSIEPMYVLLVVSLRLASHSMLRQAGARF